jgi:hypothetical protein
MAIMNPIREPVKRNFSFSWQFFFRFINHLQRVACALPVNKTRRGWLVLS